MRTRPLLALAVTLAFAPLSGAAAQNISKTDLVLASVNGQEITGRHLVARLLEYRGEEAREKMILRAILNQEAARLKLSVTDQELSEKLLEIQRRFKNDADYKGFLERSRVKEAHLKEELRNTLLIQKVALQGNPIPDSELDQYDVRMMTAPDKATAEKWVKDLDNGGNFARLASERADDPQLRAAQGRVKPFLRIEMLDIWQAMQDQKLKPGAYTKIPVELPGKKWALIKYEALIPASNASASEKDRLQAAVLVFRVDQWLSETRKKAKVEKKALTEPVIAVVNGENLPQTALIQRLLTYSGEEALSQLANRTLLTQAAKTASVEVSEAEADKRFQEAKKAIGDDVAYQAYLERSNLSEKQFRDELRYTLLMEKVALKESPISDDDLQRYDARILTAPSMKVGLEWIEELNKGADFIRMVQERSLNQESRPAGGRLKPFLRVELLDVWRAIDSQKLKPGSYTKTPVLLTDNSWAIIKLEKVMPAAGLKAEDKEALSRQVTRYRVDQWLSQARSRAKISFPTPVDALTKS